MPTLRCSSGQNSRKDIAGLPLLAKQNRTIVFFLSLFSLCLINEKSLHAAGIKRSPKIQPSVLSEERRQAFFDAALESIPSDSDANKVLSPYFFVFSDDPKVDQLPLRSTRAEVQISGVIAQVAVTQVYKNEGKNTLEALYIFPASTRAAVFAMTMSVGNRLIEAQIRKRDQAREEYEQALQDGKTASLLEQQRPNVFQMSVGNILPGDEIRVELFYTELLVPENKLYEFVYPTVVGPRYSNRNKSSATDKERWVESPTGPEGESPLLSFGLDLDLQSAIPVASIVSPSHEINLEFTDDRTAHVRMKENLETGNRDFVLQYRLAGEKIETGLLLYTGEQEKLFLLMMEPPERVDTSDIVPREYIFIMDVSGSMQGAPLEVSKKLMYKLLSDLRSMDSLNVLLFSGGSARLASRSLPATGSNIHKAVQFIDEHAYDGGATELLPALRKALTLPRTPGTSRIIVIATDGYVDVEKEAFETIGNNLGEANLFAFGIGSSVNRFLIEGLARAGMGEPFVVLAEQEAEQKADQFRKYISSPLLQGIEVKFEGFDTYDIEPPAIPDLFANRPIVLFGKYRGEPKGSIVVRGQLAQGAFENRVDVADGNLSEKNSALRLLWARHRIMLLADMNQLEKDQTALEEITKLGLNYHLMTENTSFVAVDTLVRTNGEDPITVKQPLPMPQGVSNLAIGGGGGGLGGTIGSGGGFGQGVLGSRPERFFTIHVSAPMILGSLSSDLIKQVIRDHRNQVRACYERELSRNPLLSGKIAVQWVIEANGEVSSVTIVSDSLQDQALEQCLIEKIKSWKFPTVKGGGTVIVNYPFVFHRTP